MARQITPAQTGRTTDTLRMLNHADIADAMPARVNTRHPVARTKHECCECLGVIVPGTVYEHVRGIWNGRWRGFKTCTPCVELRHEANEGGPFLFEELAETVDEWWRGWQPSGDAEDRAEKAALAGAVQRFRQRLRRRNGTAVRTSADRKQ